MLLFGLWTLVQSLHTRPFLIHCEHYLFETSHTYPVTLDDNVCQAPYFWFEFWPKLIIMPLFELKTLVKPLHAKPLLRHCDTVYDVSLKLHTLIFRVRRWPCVSSSITVNWLLTELCTFMDFLFKIKLCKFFACKAFSQTLCMLHIALKLLTLIQGLDITFDVKFHNCEK